jgi:hypothetical protein
MTTLIFTDGSKNPQGMGSRVAIYQTVSNNIFQPIITTHFKLSAAALSFKLN